MPDGDMTRAAEQPEVHAGDHVVLFYEREHELAATVGAYLAEALTEEAPAVVIATPAHLTAFTARLEAAGIDTARRRQRGTLVLLDAAKTMASFTVAGRLDPDAFEEVIGAVLHDAARAGGAVGVRAYGEMVGLLWEAGDVLGAIELERLWNNLSHELEFSLLCGYHSALVSSPEHSEALRELCHLHSSVLESEVGIPGPDELCGLFLADSDAPSAARHFATPALRRWGLVGSGLENARVVLSELATNAVVHAGSPFSVTLRSDGSQIRISVTDRNRVRPSLCEQDSAAPSGRGLHLVNAFASAWGVEVSAVGKTVWATFAL